MRCGAMWCCVILIHDSMIRVNLRFAEEEEEEDEIALVGASS